MDIAFGPPLAAPYRWVKLPAGDPRATSRVFWREGERWPWSYRFRAGEDRQDLSPDTVRRQRREAEAWETRPVSELIPGYTPTGTGSGGAS